MNFSRRNFEIFQFFKAVLTGKASAEDPTCGSDLDHGHCRGGGRTGDRGADVDAAATLDESSAKSRLALVPACKEF
jgi:hypothetical protein